MDKYKNKSFTLSVDLLLTIVLVLSILAGITFSSLYHKIGILQSRIERLEDSDIKMDNLKQKLLENFMKKGG